MTGSWKREPKRAKRLSYPTMSKAEIEAMPIADLADDDAHLWLWTTNAHIETGFSVMRAWGFKYLAPIHWVKPSGFGCWFAHRTQTMLFGYRKRCVFPLRRYAGNVIQTTHPARHSEKPEEAYALIEAISPCPRLELFARRERPGWTVWGNEVPCKANPSSDDRPNSKGGNMSSEQKPQAGHQPSGAASNALLGGVTLTLQPAIAVGRPVGDVAYMRMPLSLGAMASLEEFIGSAYGKDCVCTEDPKGWLKVSTPNTTREPRAAE